jgi:proton-translocating NAD(P)+ transhydrogenase subunit alpha
MPVSIGVPAERVSGESRVALTPDVARRLRQSGAQIYLQRGAGDAGYFPDRDYTEVTLLDTADQVFRSAQLILKVQPPLEEEIAAMTEGTMLIALMQPGRFPERVKLLCERRISSFAMELIPRISRAQSMDALSSQASVAGYQAALMAAQLAPRFFPMLTTAAGTIRPARVLVIGAGVAGLQAIATAHRLGAAVEAYDVRAAAKEQVESLGARFVSVVSGAEAAGGYARELTAEEQRQQREKLATIVAGADAVIATAAVPGRPAPKIIAREMVARMKPGAVIIDLAADSGGNCELTEPGKLIRMNGVTINGPLNLPSTMPVHASEMYARNLQSLLGLFIKNGELMPDWNDEVIKGSAYTHQGQIMHAATRLLVEGEKK